MMLLRAITRSSPRLTRPKTQRFSRRFQSASESKDFFSSTPSSVTPAARTFQSAAKSNEFFSSPTSATPAAAAAVSYSAPSIPPPVTPPSSSTGRALFSVLKFAAYSAVAATLGTAGYATYAYTVDEVNEKTKSFRSLTKHPLVDSAATVEYLPQLVYTAFMSVPSKAVNTYLDLRKLIEERVQLLAEPVDDKLLPDMDEGAQQFGIMTLVLDLRGTLIYNEWKRETGWSTYKRPGLDAFLGNMAQYYEVVVYSDDQFQDQALFEKLSERGVTHYLTRKDTKYQDAKHYRDLSKLNRDPSRIIYVSGHALDNCLQPENCIPIKPWNKELDDTALIDLIPFLSFVAELKPDIRGVLASYKGKDIPSEFIERSKRLMEKQRQKSSFSRRNF